MKHEAVLMVVAMLLAITVLVLASADLHHGALFARWHHLTLRDAQGQMEMLSTFVRLY